MQRKEKSIPLGWKFVLDRRANTHSQEHASTKMKNKLVNAKGKKIVERRKMFQEKWHEGKRHRETERERMQKATNKRANQQLEKEILEILGKMIC